MKKLLLFILCCCLWISAFAQQKADLLIYNARIYSGAEVNKPVEAMAVKAGKILEVGSTKVLQKKYQPSEKIDAKGKFIYPGFIDAHSHFYGYGLGLQTVDLTGTKSWEEVLERLQTFARKNPEGWLLGRGWDQNDWQTKEYPTNEKLNALFPNRPVAITRVDGHALIANKQALALANLQPNQKLTGGEIETKNNQLTGVLIDNAVDLVTVKIPAPTNKQQEDALRAAEKNCFAVGLTTVSDCGIHFSTAQLMDKMQQTGNLKMRIYALLSDEKANYDFLFAKGKIKAERLNVRGFKVYADGALGSRGASLLKPYSDKPNWSGFLLSKPQHFDSVANILSKKDLQMCTHAIGDSGNRAMLNIYVKYLKGKNDKRWRIEHAQVVNQQDFSYFGKYSIVPSVQPTHATSDMYWAKDRLGAERLKGAYAYKQLLNQNGWLPLGTDFPVEDISPFKTFFAAVVRKDARNFPEGGFQMENALTREEALRGMTIWAAKAQFEEKEKGSLEAGKLADFVVLDKDLLQAPENELLQIQVLMTFVNGEIVFERK